MAKRMNKKISAPELRTPPNIRSVEKVLDLLNAICDKGGEVRITELSKSLGLSKDNVFRMLATLENRGLVVRGDDSYIYRLGVNAFEMGQKLVSGMSLMRKTRPVMERLARATDEAVYLVVPCNDELLMLDMVDCCQHVKVAPLVGCRLPLSSTSLGQFFNAFDPRKCRNEKNEYCISTTVQDELSSNQLLNIAEDENYFGEGVATLGIPLFNAREQVVGILAIIGPTFRVFTEERRKELLQFLINAGIVVSTSLGYVAPYVCTRQELINQT